MDEQKKNLRIIEQKTVLFYNDELLAVRGEDNNVYVSLRHLCDALSLDFAGQSQRVQRNTILLQGQRIGELQMQKGRRQFVLLRVDLVPLWLAGISTRAVREDEIRERLERYQAEAAKVLWEAFQTGRLTMQEDFTDLLKTDTPTVQAYRMIMAMAELARNQVLLESRLDQYGIQLTQNKEEFKKHADRLELIEAQLGASDRYVTNDQAMQISQAVKAIGIEIQKRTKKNEFGAIYGQLYREFGITSYKQLPAHKFEQVMAWLTDSYRSVTGATGDDLPF
jgi:hypothetical protein